MVDRPDFALPPEHVRVFAEIKDGICSIIFKAHLNDPSQKNTICEVMTLQKAFDRLLVEKNLYCAMKTPEDASLLFFSAQWVSEHAPKFFTNYFNLNIFRLNHDSDLEPTAAEIELAKENFARIASKFVKTPMTFKKAYRIVSPYLHPDIVPGKEEVFKELGVAYKKLDCATQNTIFTPKSGFGSRPASSSLGPRLLIQ